jgi:peptidylprolyl isomerase
MENIGKKSILIILPTIALFGAIVMVIKFFPQKEEASTVREETAPAAQQPEEKVGLANPASVYCGEQGGTLEMIETPQGTDGICSFPNGAKCGEWDFFHRKCFAEAPKIVIDKQATYSALLKTDVGDLEIELFVDSAPATVNNFVFLASQGFYDNTTFHRIISEFMVQGGDPEGTGAGGPGYRFNDELPVIRAYERGVVAMANAGPNTNGSQFFIMTADNEDLPKNYVIFGQVTDGLNVLDKLAATPVEAGPGGEKSKPVTPPIIESVVVYEGGEILDNRPF